nr:MAG: RNA-dependent RNA polymerase [Rhizoctonia solani narnavirus 9]
MKGIKLRQYGKLKRSLPRPSRKTCEDAKRDFVKLMTEDPGPRPVPGSVKRKLLQVPVSKSGVLKPSHLISAASCIQSGRKDGGRTALLKDLVMPVRTTFLSETPVRDQLSTGQAIFANSGRSEGIARFVSAYSEQFPIPNECNAKVLVVKELGCKARIVTINDASQVAHAQAERDRYFSVLEKDQHTVTSEALRDPELLDIDFGPVKESEDLYVYSADFSKATDMLSHEVLDFLCSYLEIDPRLVHRGSSLNGVPIKTGTFMGLPVGWTLLSFTVYAVCRVVDPAYRFRLKGDDVISLWTKEQIDDFIDLSLKVGLIVNDKSVTARLRGTFCEGDYNLVWRNGHRVLKREATYSLRSFVSTSPLGSSDVEVLVRRGVNPHVLQLLQHRAHKALISQARAMGVDLYAPRRLGGLGLACSPDTPLSQKGARMAQLLHNGIGMFYEPTPGISDLCAKYTQIVDTIRWSPNWPKEAVGDPTSLADLRAQGFGICAYLDARAGRIRRAAPDPSPGLIVRRLWQFTRDALANRSSTYHPTTVGEAYDLLARSKPCQVDIDFVFGKTETNLYDFTPGAGNRTRRGRPRRPGR